MCDTSFGPNFRGQVADPSGALIPGVKITATTNTGEDVASVVSDATGSFLVRGLKPGEYSIRATFDGFIPFQSRITLAAGQPKRMNIVMAIEVAEQKVVVSDEAAEVNLDAGGNTSVVMLKSACSSRLAPRRNCRPSHQLRAISSRFPRLIDEFDSASRGSVGEIAIACW